MQSINIKNKFLFGSLNQKAIKEEKFIIPLKKKLIIMNFN